MKYLPSGFATGLIVGMMVSDVTATYPSHRPEWYITLAIIQYLLLWTFNAIWYGSKKKKVR